MCCTHLQMATIDLIDNFQVARQQMSEQVDWPSLQSLGKDGVVGVGTRAHADVPSLRVSEMKKIATTTSHRASSQNWETEIDRNKSCGNNQPAQFATTTKKRKNT